MNLQREEHQEGEAAAFNVCSRKKIHLDFVLALELLTSIKVYVLYTTSKQWTSF